METKRGHVQLRSKVKHCFNICVYQTTLFYLYERSSSCFRIGADDVRGHLSVSRGLPVKEADFVVVLVQLVRGARARREDARGSGDAASSWRSALMVFSSPRAQKEACAHERRGRQLTSLYARGSTRSAPVEPLAEGQLTLCASCDFIYNMI